MDVAAVGRQFGLNEEQTRAALDALVPVVAAGVRRTAQSPEGLQEIFKQVLTGSHGGALDDAGAASLDRAKPAGDEVLGQIFGKEAGEPRSSTAAFGHFGSRRRHSEATAADRGDNGVGDPSQEDGIGRSRGR